MILGVDIGTSNIKFVWYDGKNCVDEKSCSTLDTIVAGLQQGYKEQNPKKILEILDNALATDESRRKLKAICVTGQMHGIVAWDENIQPVTNLVTWEDSRITAGDCQNLVRSNNVSHNQDQSFRLSPGYGIATLLWWRKENPKMIEKAVSCGTIMDFFVARLSKNPRVKMSSQNAHSFGCWNQKKNWLINEPLLPEVDAKYELLKVRDSRFSDSCLTMVGLGDHQASLFASGALSSVENNIYISLGTSAQLSFLVPKSLSELETYSGAAVEFRPLDEDRCVLTVASMNGGNVISHFLSQFGVNVQDIEVITKTGQLSELNLANLPKVDPRLYQERGEDHHGLKIEGLVQLVLQGVK